MKKLTLILCLIVVFMSSCLTRRKTVLMQEIDKHKTYSNSITYDYKSYALKPGDAVGVDVFAIEPEAEKAVEMLIKQDAAGGNRNMMTGGQGGGDMYYLRGFVIDDSNCINLALIGKIKIGGLSLDSASEVVRTRVNEYFKGVYVKLNFAGIRFTVLGEVTRPGKYTIPQSRLNLFEMLAMCGNFADFARRDQVRIVKATPNGAKIVTVNLLDKDVMKSPYFFVESNDIIYVEPMDRKYLGFGTSAVQNLTTTVAVISNLLIIIRLFK